MMKAIFIDNYKAHAVIESRIESFADWEIHGRLGDGIISPVTVIKSPDDRSVLLTYDRNSESTNVKNAMESQFDDERAGLWFGDMLNKDNLEVFKDMGGGTVLYADQAKGSAKTMDLFLQKMHSLGKLDHASLDALKPMLTTEQYNSYESIIPTYDDIERRKAEAKANSEFATSVYTVDENGNELPTGKIATEDIEPEATEYNGEDAFNNGLNAESGVDPEVVDFNPEILGEDTPPEEPEVPVDNENPEVLPGDEENLDNIEPGDEYNLQPEGLREGFDGENAELPDDVPEINPNFEKTSNDEMNEYNTTEEPVEEPKIAVTEVNGTAVLEPKYQNILDGINTYLEKYDMTIDQFMESVFKLKFLLNQIAGGKVPEETTSADLAQEPENLDESTDTAANVTTETPEEPAGTEMNGATSNPVQSLLTAVADEMKNPENQTEEVVLPVDNTDNVENTDENATTEIENADSQVAETISTESINPETDLINQMMKISSNDTEFFNNMIQYKERLSNETINELVSTKMYDKILTGMTVYNMINIREERARKLGLV
mgnify:FL=1|nr:MAG TPA: hypothetical protein [Caudoviricetes sp.]